MPKVCTDPRPTSFQVAAATCHVRSAIFLVSSPDRLWWKNHPATLADQVPADLQLRNDWLEHDPREGSEVAWNDFLARPA